MIDLIEVGNSKINLYEAAKLPDLFNDITISDYKKLGLLSINLNELISFKLNFPKLSLNDFFKLNTSMVDLNSAKDFMLKHPQTTIDDLCKIGEAKINFTLLHQYLEQNPKTTIDEIITKINLKNNTKKNETVLHATIKNAESLSAPLATDTECFNLIKQKLYKLIEVLWPTLSEGKKSSLLKNKECNTLLREESKKFPSFKFLSQSYFSTRILSFSKNLYEPILSICSSPLTINNYYQRFLQSLNNNVYGQIMADLLKVDPIPSATCHGMNFEFKDTPNTNSFYTPKLAELAPSFDQLNPSLEIPSDQIIKNEVTNTHYCILNFHDFRCGTTLSEKRRELTGALSTIKPTNQPIVWRRARSSFENIPFEKLEEGCIYVEEAPTCTSIGHKPFGDAPLKLMKILISPNFNVGREIEDISEYKHEKEVTLPPKSCFRYLKKVVEEPVNGSPPETVYYYELVPWTEKKDYGIFNRELAIFEANKYYGRNFKIKPEEIRIGLKSVKRPNHGLTHGTRQGYLALDLLKHLANSGDKYGKLGEFAKKIVNDPNPTKQNIIFLMALHFRAARLSETGNYFPEYEKHIKKILKKSQLVTDESEINRYANLYSEKPKLEDEENKFIMLILDITHRTDHLRQYFWDVEQSEKDQRWAIGNLGNQDVENQKSMIDFLQERADVYLKATGVFNKKKDKVETPPVSDNVYIFNDFPLFFELENNPKKLYQVMEENRLK